MRFIIIISLLVITISAKGQETTFFKHYHIYKDLRGLSVFEEPDGYVVFTPSWFQSFANAFTKIDFEGNLVWTKIDTSWDNTFRRYPSLPNMCVQINDSTYAYCGTFIEFPQDTINRKFGMGFFSSKDTTFYDERVFGGSTYDEAWSMDMTPDKGFLLFGRRNYTRPLSSGRVTLDNSNLLFIKADSFGNFEWEKELPDSFAIETASDMEVLQSGEILITYMTGPKFRDEKDHVLALYDKELNPIWKRKKLLRPGIEVFPSLVNIGDTLFAFGDSPKYEGIYTPDANAWLFAYNNNGDSLWRQTLEVNSGGFYLNKLRATKDGGIIGGGWSSDAILDSLGRSPAGPRMFKINSKGEIVWDIEYWDGIPESGGLMTNVWETSDGGVIGSGTYLNPVRIDGSIDDILIIKVDSLGCIQNQCDSIIITATFQIQNQLIESTIYPNPTDEQLTITLSQPLPTKAKIHIFSQIGQPVLQQTMPQYQQNLSLNTTQLPNGIYEIILQTDEMHALGRVMIQH